MPSGAADPKILQSLSFRGHSSGAVKTLSGFKKGFHTLPDAVTASTSAFLAKLASAELQEEAEQFFQRAKVLLNYKRKDLSLDLGTGIAVITARDFSHEIAYSLSEDEPSGFLVSRSLQGVRSPEFLSLAEADELLGGLFNEIIFALSRGAPVEQVIDAIEALEPSSAGMAVGYPSDCSHCTISVPDVEAEVRYASHELSMIFPRNAPPSQLWSAFLAVRHAFALSKDTTLGALIRTGA
jgi:hypothetical protein